MVVIGIDPGNEGAIAVIPADLKSKPIEFHDTPIIVVETGSGKKKRFRRLMNVPAAKLMLQSIISSHGDEIYAVIEKVAPMPSTHEADKGAKMGATSAFNFGKGVGLWIGLMCGLDIPYEEVHPATWKAALSCSTGGKRASVIRATQLYPHTAKHLSRVKDHGRADALMLAEFGRRSRNSVVPPSKRKEYAPDCAEDLIPGLFV